MSVRRAVTPAEAAGRKEARPASPRLTIVRSPAIQGVWPHRHWPLEESGHFVDHSHALGKRAHEHLSQRLGRVVLSFADHGAALFPTYYEDREEPLGGARGILIGLGISLPILAVIAALVLWAR